MILNCFVNDSELPQDKVDNIVKLTEERHLNDCDIGDTGNSRKLTACVATDFNYAISIRDTPDLIDTLSFNAGEDYYFTSKRLG